MQIQELRSNYRASILSLAEKYGAENIRVFGSVARGDANPRDVDFLVHFKPGTSLLDEAGLDQALRSLLQRPVDLIGDDVIRPELKPFIDAEAVPL